jgi:hypothetical protein
LQVQGRNSWPVFFAPAIESRLRDLGIGLANRHEPTTRRRPATSGTVSSNTRTVASGAI